MADSSHLNASGMKLWLLNLGSCKADQGFVLAGAGCATKSDLNPAHQLKDLVFIAVLVEHPQGLILFDTGPGPDIEQSWGPRTEVFMPTENNDLPSQIAKTGHRIEDITAVIISHLHLDHAGGLQYFKCPIYVHTRELEHAYGVTASKTDPSVYLTSDLSFSQKWTPLDFETFDFLPGIRLIRAPGHTPGLIMMEVQLAEKWLFTSDLYHIAANFQGNPQGWLMRSFDDWWRSNNMVQQMVKGEKYNLVFGHCPSQLAKYQTAPHYYE